MNNAKIKMYAVIVVRTLLGALFTFSGSNGLFQFKPMPLPEAGDLLTLMQGFIASHYMLPLLFATQLVGGLMLLTGQFTALGLTLLAPVIVNILMVHIFLEPTGLPIAIAVTLAELFLAYMMCEKFRPLLRRK